MTLPSWARDPLVHFLIAGAALFAFFAWQGEEVDPASREIFVSRQEQARLSLQFERTMRRPPSDAELDGLVERWVREEVLYREALRLGLDQGDPVVRRRMAKKMDELAAAQAEIAVPSDTTLEGWLADNPARFAAGTRHSFDQLWFEDAQQAKAALQPLEGGASWRDMGGDISLPPSVTQQGIPQIEARFGRDFASALAGLEPGDGWHGPIRSGFGWHLVRLQSREVGETPPLSQIRSRVEKEWRTATISARRAAAYAALRDAYSVEIAR